MFFQSLLVGDHLLTKHTTALLSQLPLEVASTAEASMAVQWGSEGDRVYIKHIKPVKQVCWHVRGDYVATVAADGKVQTEFYGGSRFTFTCVCC